MINDRGETLQLFDMEVDPRELLNRAGRDDRVGLERALKARLLQWRLQTEMDQL